MTALEAAARDAARFLLDNFIPSPEFYEEHGELVKHMRSHGRALRTALRPGKEGTPE